PCHFLRRGCYPASEVQSTLTAISVLRREVGCREGSAARRRTHGRLETGAVRIERLLELRVPTLGSGRAGAGVAVDDAHVGAAETGLLPARTHRQILERRPAADVARDREHHVAAAVRALVVT